jgi:hypothetical protein
MPTLTSSSTFTIGSGSVIVETVAIPILPLVSPGTGFGRLIHPTLGTLDYDYSPDEWVNLDQDVIIPPTWATQKTLQGAINTLWQGDIRDVLVEERWINDPNVTATFLRMLLAFWQTPPDPVTGTPVQWWPNYATTLGFNVIILGVPVGSGLSHVRERDDGQVLNHYANDDNWITEPVTISMRVLGRAT